MYEGGMGSSEADHMTSKEALYGVDTFNMSCTTMEGVDAEKDSLLLPQNTGYKVTLLHVLLDILRRGEGDGEGIKAAAATLECNNSSYGIYLKPSAVSL